MVQKEISKRPEPLLFEQETPEIDQAVQKVQEILLQDHTHLFQASLLDPAKMDELKLLVARILEEQKIGKSPFIRGLMLESVLRRIAGFGKLDPLLQDVDISEIMVNGPNQVFVERRGKIELVENVCFSNEEEVLALAKRIVSRIGRSLNGETPLVDAKLPDGSRVNCAIPPVAKCATITIRRFQGYAFSEEKLIEMNAMTEEMALFLKMIVKGKLNVVISGATSTGKTSMLRLLASYIPETERLVTIEDIDELRLTHPNLVALEANKRQTIHDLLVNALRQRPDRIIVGELRGAEAFELLDAMGTGHEGSMTTLHARSPYQDTVKRLGRAMLRASLEIPFDRLIDQIQDTIDVVVFVKRFADGTRKISHIVEVMGDRFSDLFRFEYAGIKEGVVQGAFRCIHPLSQERRMQIYENGIEVPERFGGNPS